MVLTLIWWAFGAYQIWLYSVHAKLIGGAQYFAHLGLGGAVTTEMFFIGGTFLLGAALLFNVTFVVKVIATVIGIGGLAFALASLFPIWPLHLLDSYKFPFGIAGAAMPWIIALLAAISLSAVVTHDDPQQKAKPNL